MKAQELYDLREATGFCDGADLHRFFEVQTGNPSPAGEAEIDAAAAAEFVLACEATVRRHAKTKFDPRANEFALRLLLDCGNVVCIG